MTVDHVGMFLYPDQQWFRVIGRAAFPIFLFLVGYSKSTKVDSVLIICAILGVASSALTFYPIFPTNILVSIIAARLLIKFLNYKNVALCSANVFVIVISLLIWYLPLFVVFDYGTLALLFAFSGNLKRKIDDGEADKKLFFPVMLFTLLFYMVLQQIDFKFSVIQLRVLLLEMVVLGVSLALFKQATKTIKCIRGTAAYSVLIVSRYSLVYYVAHRALLQVLSLYLTPSHEHIFKWIVL